MKATNTDAGTGPQTVVAKKFFYTQQETAEALGLSLEQFKLLRKEHPVYEPDSSASLKSHPKRDTPLWSADLVELIALARTFSAPGVRELTGDEAFEIRKNMNKEKLQRYLAYLGS